MRHRIGTLGSSLFVVGLLIGNAHAQGQELPRHELFGGYSFSRLDLGDDPTGVSLGDFSVNGWHAEFTRFFNDRVGLAVEVTGHYRSNLDASEGNVFAEASSVRHHGLLVGPNVRVLRRGLLLLSLHALVGVARGDAAGRVTVGGVAGNSVSELELDDIGPAAAFGGDLDLRLREGLLFRVAQPNYYVTTHGDDTHHTLRLSTGVVFEF